MAASTTFSQAPQGQSPHRFELAASHKVFFWPKVTAILRNLRSNLEEDLQPLREGGTAWLIEENLAEHTITGHARLLGPQSPSEAPASWQMNGDVVRRSIDAYFSSFNMMHPMLDLNDFLRKVAQPILSGDQNGGQIEAILLLLVSALGQAAIAGYAKEPVHQEARLPSGFRGGSLTEHPGQNDFAEAERRLHSITSTNSLEHVQAHTLLAMYRDRMQITWAFGAQHQMHPESVLLYCAQEESTGRPTIRKCSGVLTGYASSTKGTITWTSIYPGQRFCNSKMRCLYLLAQSLEKDYRTPCHQQTETAS